MGEAVAAAGRLGIFGLDPPDQDQDVSAIRRIADDGALYLLDYAGTALIRIRPGAQSPSIAGVASNAARVLQAEGGVPEILVDTTRFDPADRVGLARLLRVETARRGVSVVLALRADHSRGIYRLEGTTLTRLGLLPGPVGPAELAISDAGEIAFVATSSAGSLALFQTTGGRVAELLRQGLAFPNGGQIGGFSDLTSNGAGDLAVRIEPTNGQQTVLRVTQRRGFEQVALTGPGGTRVARDLFEHRRNERPGILTALQRPRIGPDGSVAFLGVGAGFANFYVDGAGRLQQPMLAGPTWGADPSTFDYKGAANGAVVVRAAPGGQAPRGCSLACRPAV